MRQLPLRALALRDYSLRRTPWRSVAMIDRRRSRQQRRWPAWLRDLQRFAGVYLVRDAASKEIVYVGKASRNLKETICRHFYA